MRVHARLTHPNIVAIYDAEEIEGRLVIAMEFVDGGDLSDLVQRKGPLPVPVAAELMRQAAEGLSYVHERELVHRDIKPSNLMLTRNGVVKLLDLGLARLKKTGLQDGDITHSGVVLGSPAYMSPEQAAGKNAGPASDFYSLGATFFYLLAGRPPFEGSAVEILYRHIHEAPPSLSKLGNKVPSELEHLLEHLMAKERERAGSKARKSSCQRSRNSPQAPFWATSLPNRPRSPRDITLRARKI